MHFDGTITWEFIGTIVFSILSVVGAYFNLKNKIEISSTTLEELESTNETINNELGKLKEDLQVKYNLNKSTIHDEIKTEIEELNKKHLVLENNIKKDIEKLKGEVVDIMKNMAAVYEEKLTNIQNIAEERLSNIKRESSDKITKLDSSMEKELEAIKNLFFRKLDEANTNITTIRKNLSNLEIKLEKYNANSISNAENLKYVTKIVEKNENDVKLLMERLLFKNVKNDLNNN